MSRGCLHARSITDRSFGIGPEIKYTNIIWRLGFDFRYEAQFGVEAKTSGNVFVIGDACLTCSAPPCRLADIGRSL